MRIEDYRDERVARYLELAEAAQEAASRAATTHLRETYAGLAEQWLHLADLAQRTYDLSRTVAAFPSGNEPDARAR